MDGKREDELKRVSNLEKIIQTEMIYGIVWTAAANGHTTQEFKMSNPNDTVELRKLFPDCKIDVILHGALSGGPVYSTVRVDWGKTY